MVTGDAVNVAARLEQSAEPGGIVVAERTARAARGFRFRELGERELRGKEQPVAAVVLEERTPGAKPSEASRACARRWSAATASSSSCAASTSARPGRDAAEPRDDLRRPRRGQEPARRRVRRLGRSDRHRRPTIVRGPMPALRRRGHVLAARRDPQGARGRSATAMRRTWPSNGSSCSVTTSSPPTSRRPRRKRRPRSRTAWASRIPRSRSDRWSRARSASRSTPRGGRCSPRSRAGRPVVVVIDDIHWADQVACSTCWRSSPTASSGRPFFLCPARPGAHRAAARAGAAASATSRRSGSTRSPLGRVRPARGAAAVRRRPAIVRARADPRARRRATRSSSRRSSAT